MFNNYNAYPNYGQPIQQYQQQIPQSFCYFVNSSNDLLNTRVMPNVYHIGINKDNKEIYVKKMNNDGNIEMETYVLKCEEKQKTEIEIIAERLTAIENVLKERKDESHNQYVAQQPVYQQAKLNATNGNVQSNDGRQKSRATNANNS